VAPEAAILVVITAGGESIGYSIAHLAALKFINQFATTLGMPVVVNVSQGMNAGAHDGRSALEVGFDEFANGGRAPGRVVVKSAGNERSKRGHAKVDLLPNSADALRWRSWIDPGWNRDRLELWWDSANSFKFQLTAPSGQTSEWVDESQPTVKGRLTGGGPFRMELVKRHPDNGDSRLVVELGTGPGLNLLAEGEWAVEIRSVKVPAQGEIHAWLERGGSRPSEFVNHTSEEMTLSIPGTALSVITVGAVDASTPIRVGAFSSYGPTRDGRNKPDVVAPGVQVQAARGGTFDDVLPMDGTSMAAPHVTGAIALLLSRATRSGQPVPTASQAGSALRQMAGNFTSRFTPSQGYGLIDVAAFLTAF
jgi:subtilisin family serine protease